MLKDAQVANHSGDVRVADLGEGRHPLRCATANDAREFCVGTTDYALTGGDRGRFVAAFAVGSVAACTELGVTASPGDRAGGGGLC